MVTTQAAILSEPASTIATLVPASAIHGRSGSNISRPARSMSATNDALNDALDPCFDGTQP